MSSKIGLRLGGDDKKLSIFECECVFGAKPKQIEGDFCIIDSNEEKFVNRLVLVKSAYKIIFSSNKDKLERNILKFPWNRLIKGSFSVRVKNISDWNSMLSKEKQLGGKIYDLVDNPKVNLDGADTRIVFLFGKCEIYCCIQITKQEDYNFRKAHNRPEHHPSSLHPRIARLMVNLCGVTKGKITDTFCGSGGILLEAGLVGHSLDGYDIDRIMIKRCEINLLHFGVDKPKLICNDSISISKKIYNVVTDIPYGKNTSNKNLLGLFSDFLSMLCKNLKGRAVIGVPIFSKRRNIGYASVIEKNGFRVVYSFDYYLHKSLTKRIYVIKKNKF